MNYAFRLSGPGALSVFSFLAIPCISSSVNFFSILLGGTVKKFVSMFTGARVLLKCSWIIFIFSLLEPFDKWLF